MICSQSITRANINKAISFCLQYEEISINLLSFLIEEKNLLFNNTWNYLNNAHVFYLDKKIIGLAAINKHKFFVYCLPSHNEEMYELILKLFDFSFVFAMMGESSFQINLKNYLKGKPNICFEKIIAYILMTKCIDFSFHPIKPCTYIEDIKIRKAKISDKDSLLNLQVGYEKEEILENAKAYPKAFSLINLEKILKNETMYIALLKDVPIAKANTNAKGINFWQIGGVYTLAHYRRCGIGTYVLSSLLSHIYKIEKKHVALFVKVKNKAAIEMYKRIGFIRKANFSITYLR